MKFNTNVELAVCMHHASNWTWQEYEDDHIEGEANWAWRLRKFGKKFYR